MCVCKKSGSFKVREGGTDHNHDQHQMVFMCYLLTFSFWGCPLGIIITNTERTDREVRRQKIESKVYCYCLSLPIKTDTNFPENHKIWVGGSESQRYSCICRALLPLLTGPSTVYYFSISLCSAHFVNTLSVCPSVLFPVFCLLEKC